MKLTWNKKNLQSAKKRPLAAVSRYPNLPFDQQGDGAADTAEAAGGERKDDEVPENQEQIAKTMASEHDPPSGSDSDRERLAQSFQAQGDKLAEDGKYREALGKWEAALTLMPENKVLHEQKAQVLLELGDAWSALKAATRATELDPSWAEAWLTLGRAQLNFGEPDSAIQSFDRALAIKPAFRESQDDRRAALNLVKRRKQLHLSGFSTKESRFVVNDKVEIPDNAFHE
ncbi:tetratricopeptide repeat protein 33 [Punica granatum]|uniref:Uncharacterized protein n=2 Tax=Punica granatum TaxID=22663 RepID=A0A2I0JFP4_PUNGR|nr:tetratricopeptide repeat protein 33 [Punica granatum]PKI54476.1 hypothetical protein CRG98_025159 [Punica granatum]